MQSQEYPWGAIHLGMDDESDPNSGVLRAEELMHMQEQPMRASAAVLSACETGQGEVWGEGLLGPSRAFQVAGIPTTILTLWSVLDEATNTIMQGIYTNLANNDTVAEAVCKAVRAVIDKPLPKQNLPWLDDLEEDDLPVAKYTPTHWAAFIVCGLPMVRLTAGVSRAA
eukprot:GHUV01057034.1.p1 GENE.GHUV01057034.1~~GHUV01057034.1.p1  ORF type:complete len:169 (+),score=32.79 GHUV01057034.1:135-641(+)